MSLLNELLGRVSESASIQNLASKVGLSPDEVESAIAALAQAHFQPTDTVQTASEATGLPAGKLNEIVTHIGGEGALGRFASLVQSEAGATGPLGDLSKFL